MDNGTCKFALFQNSARSIKCFNDKVKGTISPPSTGINSSESDKKSNGSLL